MKKIYTVIGNPIAHSLSPRLHNYWLNQNNINATYNKIKLEKNEIGRIVKEIKEQKIAGCNVTVPFKSIIIPFLDALSPEAEKTKSVNTLILENNNLVGHNTDIHGFEKAIKSLNFNIKEKKILILGAGGVVPSIIFALQKMDNFEITIINRTKEKAENLKILFKDLIIKDWGELPDFDVIINATSLGLNNEKINLDFKKIGRNKLFFDVIYNPVETDFLKQGKELGNKTENGKLMFVYQALEAFKMWHKIEPQINTEVLELLNND